MMVYFQLTILSTIFSFSTAVSVCPMLGFNLQHMSMRDKASEQLTEFGRNKQFINTQTTDYGTPVGDNQNVLTVGPYGPMLLQDTKFIEELAHFNRERIPERVVHGKAAGAFGFFKVTNDITRYCRAKLFSEVGKVTPVAARLSIAGGESGSADTVRGDRGFAVKFYTEEGNWDLVNVMSPVFTVSNPILFPSLVHAFKRNPATHLNDADMAWDFATLRPEITFSLLFIFSDRGIPYSYRYMDTHALNTYKLVNENKEPVYCKFHLISNQGIKNLSNEEAAKMTITDPDSHIRDLYDAIANGEYPSWTLYIQVMTFEQARNWRFNPFNPIKIWPEDEFPMVEVGTITLNENPVNYFAQVEQLALAPSNMVPGIQPSPDKVLQGRLFAYPDSQRYRLGVNFLDIPINKPLNAPVHNYKRDGSFQTVAGNQGGAPNYYPNSFCGPTSDPAFKPPAFYASGDVDKWNEFEDDPDNFSQASAYYRETLGEEEKSRLIQNLVNSLIHAAEFLQKRAVDNFSRVDSDLGRRIMEELKRRKA